MWPFLMREKSWTGSFTEGLPGTGPVMLIFLRGVVRFLARRLVTAAERN